MDIHGKMTLWAMVCREVRHYVSNVISFGFDRKQQMRPSPRAVSFVLACVIALFAGAAIAADPSAPVMETRTLANGLEIVVIPDRRAPVVTHMIWYKVGSADEERGKSGIAHFLEHLMFKGTKTVPEREFSEKVAAIGGQENAFTTTDYTAYYQKVDPSALSMVMRYEADRMQNLVLTNEVVLPERDVILEERRQRVDSSPGAILGESINAALYANHPYGVPIIGWEHEIAALTRDDALAFYNRFYTPNNALLVVAGDVMAADVFALAQTYYGGVPRRAEISVRKRPAEPEPTAARRVSYADPRIASPSLRRSYMVPSYRIAEPREAEALDILSAILGGSSTSRINNAMLVDTPVASSAGAYYQGGFYDYGEFGLYADPLPGFDLTALEKALDEQVDKVLRDGVTPGELETARADLLRTTIFERDSQTTMARIFGSVLSSGGTLADVVEWPDRIRAVSVEDVNKAARKWLDKRRSVTGELLPKEGS